MSTTLMTEEKQNNIVKMGDSDVDLNSLFTMNYNFDILKRVITSVVQQNKDNKYEFDVINEKLDEKDKMIKNLEAKINSNQRIINDKFEDKQKELEQEVNTNRESEDNLNQRIEDLEKKVNDLSKVSHENKNERTNNTQIMKKHSNNLDKLEDYLEMISMLNSKVGKIENSVSGLTIKLNEVNIFDQLKNTSGGGEGNSDMYITLIEGIKQSTEQKTDFIDNKLELLQDIVTKMKIDLTSNIKKIDHNLDTNIEKTNHMEKKIEKLYELLDELKKYGTEHTKKKSITITEPNIISNDNKDDENDAIIGKLRDLEQKIDELKTTGINIKDNTSLNTNNTSVAPIIDESAIKSKLMEIDKNFKIFSLKEKEKENDLNKKINELREQIKKKVDVENFHLLSEEVQELKKMLEELKNEYGENVPRTIEDISWMKKKLETLQGLITKGKGQTGGDNNHDINSMLNEALNQGRYVDSSNFGDYKNLVGKEFNKMTVQMDEFKILFEDLQLILVNKAENKGLQNL